MKKVLITGGAGRIGKVLWNSFKNRYNLRLMFHNAVLPVDDDEESVVANVADFRSVIEAVIGCDVVVHLAANPSVRASWDSVLTNNIIGTYNVFEASRRGGVRKIVFASTNHVTGFTESMVKNGDVILRPIEERYAGLKTPPRPDSLYGVSKAFGEALANYYADKFGISIICLRIGSFLGKEYPGRLSGRTLSTWISNRDMTQLVWRSIETDLPFGIFYGISDNTRKYWDISNAKTLLGYAPKDDAEDYVEREKD